MAEILVLISTIVSGVLAQKKMAANKREKIKEKKLQEKEAELQEEKKVNSLLKENVYITKLRTLKQIFDLRSFSKIEQLQHQIFNHTSIDRMTIMIMMNGKVKFNFMSVVYDHSNLHEEVGSDSPYKRFEIDDEYMEMITELTTVRGRWESSPFKDLGEIGEFLELENIGHIGWWKVKRIALDDYNDLFVYLSLSSEKKEKINWREKRQVELIVHGKIVPILGEIVSVPTENEAIDLLKEIHGDKPHKS